MTGARDAALQALRLKYNAALTAHQGCIRALTEATMAGATPSPVLVQSEANARQELDLARDRLLAAMTEAITGEPMAARAGAETATAPSGSAGRPSGTS